MKTYKKYIKVTIINTLLFSTLAMAEVEFNLEKEKSELSNKVFNHYDLNKDKTLSFDEFIAFSHEMKEKEENKRIEETMKSCDKNHNDKIESTEVPTEEEMEEAFKKGFQNVEKMCHIEKMEFNNINKNQDDFITKEEIKASYNRGYSAMWDNRVEEMPKVDEVKDFKKQLERCDKNKDREITLIEATSDICYMTSEEFLEYSSSPEKSFSIDEITHPPKSQVNVEARFKRCDTNNDSQLNLLEATSMFCNMPSDEFIKLDSDKNNFLTKTEIQKLYDEEQNEHHIVPVKIFKEMPPMIQISIALNQCDENKDRKLTRDEAESCELPMKTFEQYDYDKSNTIESNDMKMVQEVEEFKMADMNSNKKLEPKEFEERMGNRCRSF